MLQAILQPEISTLEFQVAQMQAQIAALEQRIKLLNEAEFVTDGAIQALQGAIKKVSTLAPDAITSLKSVVLKLFGSSDSLHTSTDGSNQPVNPGTEPDLNSGYTKLACALEDAPTEALKGQSVELACIVPDAFKEESYIELVQVKDVITYQRKQDGEILCAYIGFRSKSRAEIWGKWLCVTNNIGSGFQVRVSKRMPGFKHELKVWGLNFENIKRLSTLDFTKAPNTGAITLWVNPEDEVAIATAEVEDYLEEQAEAIAVEPVVKEVAEVTDRDIEECLAVELKLEIVAQNAPEAFEIGDEVEITSDRHGEEFVWQTGTITAATSVGCAVNVNGTLRWYCTDEIVRVETGAELMREAKDSLFPDPTWGAIKPGVAQAVS